MKTLVLISFFALSLSAKLLTSPIEAMQSHFGTETTVVKKNILLNKELFTKVQQAAKVKLDTKIYRVYIAKKADKAVGYGILISRKVRSKNAVTLYIIEDDQLQTIEIIAFNEPLEYIPSRTWQQQFQKVPVSKQLRLKKEIPTITGATLSARAVTDGSQVAFAIYKELFKGE